MRKSAIIFSITVLFFFISFLFVNIVWTAEYIIIESGTDTLDGDNSLGTSGQRALARTSDGHLHSVYYKYDADLSANNIFYAESDDDGATWTETQLVYSDLEQTTACIATDSEDRIYVFWNGLHDGIPGLAQIRYKIYNNSWSEIFNMTNNDTYEQLSPYVAVNETDAIHVVWQGNDVNLHKIRYEYSTSLSETGEISWSDLYNISDVDVVNNGDYFPSIAIDNDDIVHFIWEEGYWDADFSYIQYRSFDGTSLSATEDVTSQDGSDTYVHKYPSIIVDCNNTVHCFWVNTTTVPENFVQYRSFDGSIWSDIETIESDADDLHTYHSVSSSLSKTGAGTILHVVWEVDVYNEVFDPFGTIISYSNYTSSWLAPVSLTDTPDSMNKSEPCLLYASYPNVSSVQTEIPLTGYAFVYLKEASNITYHASDDLTFAEVQTPPFITDENPVSASIDVNITLEVVNVTISDANGDSFDWIIGGDNLTTNSSAGDTDGIKNASVIGPLSYATAYTWWVNATDDDGYTNESYTFTTEIYHGDTVYVDDDFTPATPGWQAGKYDTLADAYDSVNAGGTIYIYAGQYDEQLTIAKTINLTGIAGTYYQNHEQIILNCSETVDGLTVQAPYVNISGFMILNPKIGIYMGANADNCSIKGMVIDNSSEECIFFYNSCDTLVIKNNFSTYDPRSYNAVDFQDAASKRNIFYQNNFLLGAARGLVGANSIWNASYPIGGNYWFIYEDAEDNYQGAGQNVSGSDGFADDEYLIPSGSDKDYYPLMSPYEFENHPPYVYNPVPIDIGTGISITHPNLRITIEDPEDDAVEWMMECDYITNVHLTGQAGGLKTVPITSTMPYFEIITWYVNASDGNGWINTTHTFTTQSQFTGTIQDAIDAAVAGDIIFVYRGNFEENIIVDKPLIIEGENMNETTIDGGGTGDTISIASDDVIIRNFTITNGGALATDAGIDASNVDNITLSDNSIEDNSKYGIYLSAVTNSNIYENILHSNSLYGLYSASSDFNLFLENYIDANTDDGIRLSSCDSNVFSSNIIINNGDEGIEAVNCNSNMYDNNTITDNAGIGLFVQYDDSSIICNNMIKLNTVGGMTLFNDQQNIMFTGSLAVYDNVVGSNGDIGIDLWGADACAVYRNNVSGNDPAGTHGGIRLYWGSDNNSIFENEIIGYDYEAGLPSIQPVGIFLQGGFLPAFPELTVRENQIFHNNFYSNIVQVNDDGDDIYNKWNDSYPSGGNYFDDFDEESEGAGDKFQGPNQDILGADGICDSNSPAPYNIPGTAGSQDHYPLKNPYGVVLKADFIYVPQNPKTNQKITFIDSSVGYIISYKWTFGDGTTGSGKNVFHMYTKEDFYTVTLRVTDRDGNVDVVSKILAVGSNLISIPPLQPPKYPNSPFTVPEMYELLRATMKSDAKVVIVIIDSGNTQRMYDSIDLTPISMIAHPTYQNGIDKFGHGSWVNYAVRYGIQTFMPNCMQISIRAFDEKGTCGPETFLQSLDMAKNFNPDIVTISAGIFGTSDDEYSKKISELRSAGILVTVSAGNEGPEKSTITSPACGADLLAIGAIDPLQPNGIKTILDLSDDIVCEFSSRGPVEGISPKPDFTAPGESIIGPWLDGDKVASGTSMAAPLTASVALQVIAVNKPILDAVKFIYGGRVYLNILETSIMDSAYDKGNQDDYGWGIPNAELAARFAWIKAMYALAIFFIVVFAIILTISIVIKSTRTKKRASFL